MLLLFLKKKVGEYEGGKKKLTLVWQAAMDMSPFVRKIAANSLPKLFSIAPSELEGILEILEKLLGDRTHVCNHGDVLFLFSALTMVILIFRSSTCVRWCLAL